MRSSCLAKLVSASFLTSEATNMKRGSNDMDMDNDMELGQDHREAKTNHNFVICENCNVAVPLGRMYTQPEPQAKYCYTCVWLWHGRLWKEEASGGGDA